MTSIVIIRYCDKTTWLKHFMVQCQKIWLCAKFKPPMTSLKKDVILSKYGRDISTMMPSTQNQRWSRRRKARGQGQGHKKNPRPALPRTDTLEAKDRNARDQSRGPRTQTQVFSKKKGLQKNFLGDLHKQQSTKNFFSRFTKFYPFKK